MIFGHGIDVTPALIIELGTFSRLLAKVEYRKEPLLKLKFELREIKISKEAGILLF